MKDEKIITPQSAHQILFQYMISRTREADVNKLCQILRDHKKIDDPNPETGATLLGLATLFLPDLVYSLLKYGADVNQPTGLITEKNGLPFTVALKRMIATYPSELFLPSSKIPDLDTLRPQPLMTQGITQRSRILEMFLCHPELNLNQREFSPETKTPGKTVMDWAKELKLLHYFHFLLGDHTINKLPPTVTSPYSLSFK